MAHELLVVVPNLKARKRVEILVIAERSNKAWNDKICNLVPSSFEDNRRFQDPGFSEAWYSQLGCGAVLRTVIIG